MTTDISPRRAPDWERCKSDFAWDGSLRDLYVQGTTMDDWLRCLAWLRSCEWPISYTRDGKAAPFPETLTAFLEGYGHMLSVNVGGVLLNTHFFSLEEIEFDLDPQEVDSEERFGSLLSFLAGCGRATGKVAIVTCENFPQKVILRYCPNTDEVEFAAPD